MAVVLITGVRRYVGLSTDTKPTDAQTVAGAEFYETDSQALYVYDGVAWQYAPRVEAP
jgi:hypothetical protein